MSDEKELVDVGVELDKRTKSKNDTFYVDVGKDIDIDISVSETITGSSMSGSPIQKKQDSKSCPKGTNKPVEKLESPKEVLIGGNGKKLSGISSTNSSLSQIPVPKSLNNISSSSSIKTAKTIDLKDISNKPSPSQGTRDRSNSFASSKELPSPERKSTGFEKSELNDGGAKKSISLQKLEKPSLPLPLTPAVSPTKLYASEKGKEVSPLSSDPNYDKLKSPDDLFLVSCHEIQSKVSPVLSIQGPDIQNPQDNRPPTPEYSLPSKLQNKPSSPLPKKHTYTSQSPSNKTSSELYLLSTKRDVVTNIPGSHWTPLRMLQEPKQTSQRKDPTTLLPEKRLYQDEKPLNDSITSDGGRGQPSKIYEPNIASPVSQYQEQEEQSRTSLIAEIPDEKKDKGEEADSDEHLLQEIKAKKKSPLLAKKHKETPYGGSFEGSGIRNEEGSSSDAWLMTLSAIYGKVLLIIGLVLPLTEVISDDIPTSFFEGFFLYLYYVSILFLAFVYVSSCRKSKCGTQLVKNIRRRRNRKEKEISAEEGVAIATDEASISTYTSATIDPQLIDSNGRYLNYGSLYLRIATVAFGIGSMVYTGLECSQFFELDPGSKCYSVLQLAGPLTRLAFIFLQTYFVFMNSKLISRRYKAIFCFGLIHMIATNICIWISVVITEAKIEVDALEGYFPDSINQSGNISDDVDSFESLPEPIARRRIEPMSLICHRTGIMGKFLNRYSPFLSPCVIAYSLISSGILFVIWRRTLKTTYERSSLLQVRIPESKQSLDGSHSNRGLFIGVILFVSAILSLILYFILVEQPSLRRDAVVALNCVELTLYTVTLLSVLLGIYEMRVLRFRSMRTRLKLDNALLVVSQTGIMVYCIFTITASYFSSSSSHLMLFASLANLLQTCGQTLFVLNAMRRVAKNMEQVKKKPGRQVVTFLFVANYAMWALNIFEKSRAEAHPLQLDFFGVWAWSVVSQITLPLAIFYRFHSTVCLFEVWKNCYKLKPDQL